MGDFNPNSPSPLGMEARFNQKRHVEQASNVGAYGMRFRPGATTITAIHHRFPIVKGASGIMAEIVSALGPATTVSYFYPGSDTGKVTTNVQDQAAGAVNFGDVNSPFQTANYATNNVALIRGTGNPAELLFRGNSAGALAGRRILRVRIGATLMNIAGASTSDPRIPITGKVVMGGATRIGNLRFLPRLDAFQRLESLADWYYSPITSLPWTVTEVDNIISAANADTFGIDIFGKLDITGFRCTGLWIEVTHCLENRMGFYYARGNVRQGWDRYALSSTSAEAANTEYYAVLSTLTGSWTNHFRVPLMIPTQTSDIPTTAPTDNTHDHRRGFGTYLTGPGGVSRDETSQNLSFGGEFLEMLFEAAGPTILGESQPYGTWTTKDVYSGGTANIGQQITSPGAVPAGYAAVQFTVGWQDQTTRPDRPLVIQIRHGAGAITGGGSLDATAVLDPSVMATGTFQDVQVNFLTSFVPAINTQYHVIFSSPATNGSGWRLLALDTRSDDIQSGSGTTLANVEGASQGGQTDSYIEAGAQLTRYDIATMLIPNPAAPTLTATAVPAVAVDSSNCCTGSVYPPHVRLTWVATALGASFGAYNIYRRRRTTPVQPWAKIAQITVPTLGPTAAQVEANWTEFRDFEATWTVAGSIAADGWDYAITVYNTATNLEAIIGSSPGLVTGVQPPPSQDDWEVCNAAPWLNWPLRIHAGHTSKTLAAPKTFPQVAGRDFGIVRVQGTVPGRSYALKWQFLDPQKGWTDEWNELRGPRAAARSGRQIAIMRVRGERSLGIVSEPHTGQSTLATVAEADLFITSNESALTGSNFAAGLVLNGTTQYASSPDSTLLKPGTGPFTVFAAGLFPTANGKVHLSKGSLGAGTSFGLRNISGVSMAFSVNGVDRVTITTPTDGQPHVIVAVGDQNVQSVYIDGVLAGSGTATWTTATSTTAFVAGADNGGASGFSALAPLRSWGYYPRALTVTEAMSLSRYLLSNALQNVPVGASAFYDLRDQRCWDGADTQVYDLSGNGLTAASVASPVPRGNPWPLGDLELGR